MNKSLIKTSFIESVMNSYLTPTDKNLHKIFMPISQYPEVYGLTIKDSFNELTSTDVVALHLEFSVDNMNEFGVEISAGGLVLNLYKSASDKRSKLFYLDKQIASLPPQKNYTFNLRVLNDKLYLAINERRLICIKENISSFVVDKLDLKVNTSHIYLINFQLYDIDWKLTVKEYSYYNDKVSTKITNTSPKYVLLWEHRSKELYHALILAYELLREGKLPNTEIQEKIQEFSSLVVKMLEAWPKWRPSSNSQLGSCVWETNNWCNGYLPSAYALASRIINNKDTSDFITKGVDWLVDKRYVKDIRMIEKFPPVTHWLNRSTNHGIVILSTFLVGACVLGILSDNRVQALYQDLKSIINNSFTDGSYLESVSYFQFIILELIPLFHYLSITSNVSFDELANKDFGKLSHSIDFVNAVTNHDIKEYFAKYGDCEPAGKWFSSVLIFLSAISSEEKYLNFIPDLKNREHEIYYFLVSSMHNNISNKTSLKSLKGNNDYYIEHQHFNYNQFASLKYKNPDEVYYLWMNGSRLHKTHNKDNDLGSFYLSDHLGEIFVKKNGVDIRNHNVVTVKELLNEKGISTSVSKVDIHEYTLPRGMNGEIDLMVDNKEACVFKHTAMSYFRLNDTNLIQAHSRFYVVLKEENFNLVIIDKIIAPIKVKCEAIFHIHSNVKLGWDASRSILECDRIRVSSLGGSIELYGNLVSNISDNHSKANRLVTFIRSNESSIELNYIEELLYKLSI